MWWSTLLARAGPWATPLALCGLIVWAFVTDRVISGKRYERREKEHEADLAAERRISDYQEKTAAVERDRADKATAALMEMASHLPEALRQARAGGS